jgi:hypothetical protein
MMVPTWMKDVPRNENDWPACVPVDAIPEICTRVKAILATHRGKTLTIYRIAEWFWHPTLWVDTPVRSAILRITPNDARYAVIDRACRAIGATRGYSLDA